MTTRPVVLCVDDDPDMLTSVARLLRRDAYEVVTSSTPAEALTILSSRAVDVLVSDFEMPEMNGVELAVRARCAQPETVRILLTGRNTVDTVTEGINVGEVYRFLAKPFNPDVLRREVAAAVAHHQEIAAVAQERSTVVRRQRMMAALEQDFPGITAVPRDDTGAYLLDFEASLRPVGPNLAALAALVRR
jgi:DNA-binding NtrC family response regulator